MISSQKNYCWIKSNNFIHVPNLKLWKQIFRFCIRNMVAKC
jgi:hypothetical protein